MIHFNKKYYLHLYLHGHYSHQSTELCIFYKGLLLDILKGPLFQTPQVFFLNVKKDLSNGFFQDDIQEPKQGNHATFPSTKQEIFNVTAEEDIHNSEITPPLLYT